jgi:16S rRNA G966 N2-methylase RsmD
MVFAEKSAFGADGDGESLKKNRFLSMTKEVEELNQYWYSNRTIAHMARDVEDVCAAEDTRACFLSTPSVYFSLSKEVRARSWCFDLDTQWANEPGFVRYDFNAPVDFEGADELKGTFDMVIIDPPFITREVWEKYAETAKHLLKPGGAVMGSTIQENATLMKELLDVEPRAFMPSIPTLVYQYYLYTSYESKHLAEKNPEIPDYD